MPSAQRVGWAKLRVGIMAIVALVIVGMLVFLLTETESFFSKKIVIYTFMDDAAALQVDVPVRLNGIRVGSVSKVELSGERAPSRMVRISMQIVREQLQQIPDDSQAAISAENLLGTKYVNIKSGKSQTPVKPGGELPSLDTLEFEELQKQIGTVMTSLESVVKRVDSIVSFVERGEGSIGKLIKKEELYDRIVAVVEDVKKVTTALTTNQGTAGKLIYDDTLYQEFRRSLARLDTVIVDLQEGRGTAGKLLKDPALYDETRKTIAGVRQLVDDVNAGKGSAGKFLKSDELHTQVSATIGRVDVMLDKVNAGQGTLGQLLVNQQLYDNLSGATRELNGLFKDFRADPKKFLRIKLALF